MFTIALSLNSFNSILEFNNMAVRAAIAKFNQFISEGGVTLEEYNSIVQACQELKALALTRVYMMRLSRGDPLSSPGDSECE
jgi:hypothetical protein